MAITSTTGKGPGSSNKLTTKQLAILANGPTIHTTGFVELISEEEEDSANATVVFPTPLNGEADNYVVILTTINGETAEVIDTDEDSDGNFSGFSIAADQECNAMYMVVNVGIKPILQS